MIEIKALNKIYKTKNHKKVHALKDINLTLPDSGMVFVIGKSGSGKSTLLNLIGGLDDITSGSVIADGNDIKKLNVRKLSNYRSSYVGFIFQDYHLLEEFNVKENIELGADIANTNIDTSRILKVVGLEGYENRFIDELSGGQQQRVAIARSLAKEVKVILADEPTGNLDKETTKQILDLLKELSKDILVIVVSHNLEDANFYADRIISLDHGRLVSDREKQKNYINEFSIKNNTLFLPYHKDLTEEDIKTILEQKENITVVKQLNSGLKKTKDIIFETRNVKFESSHLSLSKFLKLFFSFFRNNKLSKILAICISAVIISLFYIFQTFSFFDDNVVLQNEIKNSEDIALVSKKCLFSNTDNSLKTSYLSPITDNDLNVIFL